MRAANISLPTYMQYFVSKPLLKKITELWTVCEGKHILYYDYLHVYSQKILREGTVLMFCRCESGTISGSSSVVSRLSGVFCFYFFPPTHVPFVR